MKRRWVLRLGCDRGFAFAVFDLGHQDLSVLVGPKATEVNENADRDVTLWTAKENIRFFVFFGKWD